LIGEQITGRTCQDLGMRPGDTRLPLRIVLIHGWAPPTRGGTAFIIERLLGGAKRTTLDVWTRATQRPAVRRGGFVLPGRYRYFPKLRSLPHAPSVLSWPITAANLVLAIMSGLVVGCAARRDHAGCILSVADEGFSQIAGAVSARVARLSHVIWVFDLWEENAYARSDRRVARWLERRLWRSASAIVVHAEELAEHYYAKHAVHAHVLRTPIDDDHASRRRAVGAPAGPENWEVLVAGSVYWAQAEALHRVAAAVREIEGAYLTVIGDPALQSETIDADRYEPARSAEALQERLQEAGLLVLGLSFGTSYPDVVRTATPARLPEYLASGVPLLVHAPAGSHAAEHVRHWDLATVVDVADVDAVADAIRSVKNGGMASTRRAERARDFAAAQHGASHVRAALVDLLESVRRA
jgi:hypothetical protein